MAHLFNLLITITKVTLISSAMDTWQESLVTSVQVFPYYFPGISFQRNEEKHFLNHLKHYISIYFIITIHRPF